MRWTGKIYVEKSEMIWFYLYVNVGARFYINHSLVIDVWDNCYVANKENVLKKKKKKKQFRYNNIKRDNYKIVLSSKTYNKHNA